jgi:hypothetical protein
MLQTMRRWVLLEYVWAASFRDPRHQVCKTWCRISYEIPMQHAKVLRGVVSSLSTATEDTQLTAEGQLVSNTCPGKFQQCAGLAYEGVQNCCGEGLRCALFNKWYSQCQVALNNTSPTTFAIAPSSTDQPTEEEDGCASGYNSCAGKNYSGKQNCCKKGYTCVFQNINYSQCRPGVAPTTLQHATLLCP